MVDKKNKNEKIKTIETEAQTRFNKELVKQTKS
jgi:hypothetical protein